MKPEPRRFRDEADLQAIDAILTAGRRAANGTYYVHVGDIRWWLYYRLPEKSLWPYLYLWEDEHDRVIGWTLLSLDEGAFDVFVQPDLVGCLEMEAAFAWSAEQLEGYCRAEGKDKLHKLWNAAGDTVTAGILQRLGFAASAEDLYLVRDLRQPVPMPEPPAGYTVRPCRGEAEVAQRARAQYGAFGSRMDFSVYQDRFLRFMHSPVYDPQRDMVVEAPDGRIAAFCIFWLDPINAVALFEPVGTHPDFQKLGLGKAVLRAALLRQQQMGMHTAILCTGDDNEPALRLYHSTGFIPQDRLVTYTRRLNPA